MSDFTVQELTLGQLLENTAARFPDTDAVIHADRELRQTWSEFSACVDDMARGLMAIGVQKGEKVAVWATNVPHWVTLMFATARIGAILVTVNTNYRETELRYLLQQSECENLFIIDSVRDHDFIASTYEVIPELRRQRRGMLEVEDLPHLKRVFFLGTDKHRGMYSLPELFSLAGDVSDEEYESRKASISPYDVVNMQYTSGTTGFPKGVMLTHVNIVNNGYWIGYHQKFSSRDRVCLPVPLFHCFGCVLGVMACVNHGATMVLLDAFSPVQVMTAVEQEKCTALYGVPTMFIAMLEHPDFSLNGAKAIFSLTGYQGILGYRTQNDRDIKADGGSFCLEENGVPTRIMSVKHNHHSAVMTELADCGAVLAGSPTHNNTVLPLVAAQLTYMKGLRPLNRVGGAFGSYGWSGEAPKYLQEQLAAMNMDMPADPVKCNWAPDKDVFRACHELGKTVAETLKKKCQEG